MYSSPHAVGPIALLEYRVCDYVDNYAANHMHIKVNDKLIDKLYNEIIKDLDISYLREVVAWRLNELIEEEEEIDKINFEHIRTKYNAHDEMNNDGSHKILFNEVEDEYKGHFIYLPSELEDDELEFCEDIIQHIESNYHQLLKTYLHDVEINFIHMPEQSFLITFTFFKPCNENDTSNLDNTETIIYKFNVELICGNIDGLQTYKIIEIDNELSSCSLSK